jgi:hypothetical protein
MYLRTYECREDRFIGTVPPLAYADSRYAIPHNFLFSPFMSQALQEISRPRPSADFPIFLCHVTCFDFRDTSLVSTGRADKSCCKVGPFHESCSFFVFCSFVVARFLGSLEDTRLPADSAVINKGWSPPVWRPTSLNLQCHPSRRISGLHWRGRVDHSRFQYPCTEELFDFSQKFHRMNWLGKKFKTMAMSARIFEHLSGGGLAGKQ